MALKLEDSTFDNARFIRKGASVALPSDLIHRVHQTSQVQSLVQTQIINGISIDGWCGCPISLHKRVVGIVMLGTHSSHLQHESGKTKGLQKYTAGSFYGDVEWCQQMAMTSIRNFMRVGLIAGGLTCNWSHCLDNTAFKSFLS